MAKKKYSKENVVRSYKEFCNFKGYVVDKKTFCAQAMNISSRHLNRFFKNFDEIVVAAGFQSGSHIYQPGKKSKRRKCRNCELVLNRHNYEPIELNDDLICAVCEQRKHEEE